MGQAEIAVILGKHYPKYLSADAITDLAGSQKRSVLRCLCQMRKRNEVEYKTIRTEYNVRSGWKTLYRMKGGNNHE